MVVPWFVILYLSQCLPATTSMELLIDCPDRLVPAARNVTGRQWACAVLRILEISISESERITISIYYLFCIASVVRNTVWHFIQFVFNLLLPFCFASFRFSEDVEKFLSCIVCQCNQGSYFFANLHKKANFALVL